MDLYELMRQAVKQADYKSNEDGEDCGPDEDHDGKISPEELHRHFDHDSDGNVTMQDYARHIALHQAHPEWLADEMAQIVAEYEGVGEKQAGRPIKNYTPGQNRWWFLNKKGNPPAPTSSALATRPEGAAPARGDNMRPWNATESHLHEGGKDGIHFYGTLGEAREELKKAKRGLSDLKTAADEMAQIVAEYEGVPVKTHGYNSGHEDKMAEEDTATKRNPELWARAKAEAKRKMGGKHSARAMQLAVQIYKKRGGGYSGPKPDASENKMRKWTKQDWQTRPGTDEKAERDDGRTARYLPKAKWESLSKSEQKATDRKKLEGEGQYVENTEKAKVKEALEKIAKSKYKNPKGGLTAAGREHFKRKDGANLKPGVKNVGKKGDAEKKRWARWAMRFYTNPRGPMKNEQGKPTRLALMANAWGTKVPGTRAEAQAIAARARKMMDGIKAREKKSSVEGYEVPLPTASRQFFGQMLPSFPTEHPMRDQMVEFANSVTAAADAAHAKQAYDLGATLQAGVTGALPMAAMGGFMGQKGQRLHDAAVQAIVGGVPSMLFDAYNQVTTPSTPAWDPTMRAVHQYGPELAQPYTVPPSYHMG